MITKFCFVIAAMTASAQVFAGANLIRNGTFEGAAAKGKTAAADVGLLPAEIGLGWENGWVKEWVRDVPGFTVTDVRTPTASSCSWASTGSTGRTRF